MTKKFMPFIAAILVVAAGFLWATRGGDILRPNTVPDQKYVNESVGGAYREFSMLASVNQTKAKGFLDQAQAAKPDNGYTDYLFASLAAIDRNVEVATQRLNEGNAKSEVVHYVPELPAHENEMTLSMLTRLSALGEELSTGKDPKAAEYYSALKTASYRVAKLEPITTLSVAAGVSLLNQVYADATKYYEKRDPNEAKKWRTDMATFKAWSKVYRQKQSTQLGNITREIGKEAGLSESEIDELAMRKPLADQGKQAKVEELMAGVIGKEQTMLRELVSTMPSATENKK